MTTDDLQLLREFRARVAVPDEMTRRAVYAYATSARSSRSPLSAPFRAPRWRSWRGVLVIAVAVAALAGAGVSIAARVGAFEGTPAPPAVTGVFRQINGTAGAGVKAGLSKFPQAEVSKAHGVIEVQTPDGPIDLWAAPDDQGGQCVFMDFANSSPGEDGAQPGGSACYQSSPTASNIDFAQFGFPPPPGSPEPHLKECDRGIALCRVAISGVVYVSAATVQVTLDDGSRMTLPVVEHLFLGSLAHPTKIVKVAAFDADGNQVAELSPN
jgi:hypothetical protein